MSVERPAAKPAYDARQRYYDLLLDRIRNGLDHLGMRSYRVAYMELYHGYCFVRPWMTETDKRELDALYKDIGTKIDESSQLSMRRDPLAKQAVMHENQAVEHLLMKVNERLMEAAKHMMLPMGDDGQADTFDENEAMRRSGL